MKFKRDRSINILSFLVILCLGPVAVFIFTTNDDYHLISDYFIGNWVYLLFTSVIFLILNIPALKFAHQISHKYNRFLGRFIVSFLLGSIFTKAFPIYAINYMLLTSSEVIMKDIPVSAKMTQRLSESCLFNNDNSNEVFLLNYKEPKECTNGSYLGKFFKFDGKTFYILEAR